MSTQDTGKQKPVSPIVHLEDPDSESFIDLPREDPLGRIDQSVHGDEFDLRAHDFDDY